MGRMRRRVVSVLGFGVLLLAVTGCGSGSEHYAATGVDDLRIPTPSPAPTDFVDAIDNPWLSLDPDAGTTYETDGGEVRVTATAGPTIEGIATTALATVASTPSLTSHTDYLAQDARGNVWWFGRDGEWRAGDDGAEAGLYMAAEPRAGDGYRSAPGATAIVAGVDATVAAEPDDYDHVVVVDTTSTDGVVERSWYADGTGLVRQETTTGSAVVVLALTAD